MIKRYIYLDPLIRSNSKYPELNVQINESSLLGIFRLISGTVNCRDEFNERTYKLRTNYLDLPFEVNERITSKNLIKPFPEEISFSILNEYFKTTKRNTKFYNSIQTEITKCLISKDQGNYLESFFYLYRIIEGVSFTLPLIYTSKARDFQKSYKQLQSFFSGNNTDGELAFFKKFIKEIYKHEDFFKSTIDIDLNTIEIEEVRIKYFSIYKELTTESHLDDLTEGEELSFKFIGFYEFLLSIRNRYFHFLQGTWQKNISSSEVLFPDLFFKPIVNQGINWVSTILFEVLKFDIDNN